MLQDTISESEARSLTLEYRKNQSELKKGFLFDKAQIDKTFTGQPETTKFRAYLGQQSGTGKLQVVMVAADADENDILDTFYDKADPCPNCTK
jgi:hypothetical protein